MEPLESGQNPRDSLRRHRERGPQRFSFTLADIARAAGETEAEARLAKRRREFNPKDLLSLSRWIWNRKMRAIFGA